jgi:hypothetical protein
MRYPTPQHLREILDPHPRQCTDHQLQGAVLCPCGSYVHSLLYVAGRVEDEKGQPYLQVIEIEGRYLFCLGAKCAACGADHLLYDDRFHGWSGYVCGSEEEREHPRPPWLEWHCATCDGAPHKITLTLQGEDGKSLIPESDGILTSANWHEGFSFLSIDLACTACQKGPVEVVSLETM